MLPSFCFLCKKHSDGFNDFFQLTKLRTLLYTIIFFIVELLYILCLYIRYQFYKNLFSKTQFWINIVFSIILLGCCFYINFAEWMYWIEKEEKGACLYFLRILKKKNFLTLMLTKESSEHVEDLNTSLELFIFLAKYSFLLTDTPSKHIFLNDKFPLSGAYRPKIPMVPDTWTPSTAFGSAWIWLWRVCSLCG